MNATIGGHLIVRLGKNIKDKEEMDGKRGSGTDRKADSRGRNDKGNIFENMKRKSKRNVGVECVDNNDTNMEENFEESFTYVDSQTSMVDDSVKKEDKSVKNSVQFDDEYSAGSGIVQISKVQNTEFILEEAGLNKNEDIVTDSLIDPEIVNEIKKINDKLQGEGDVESEGLSDMEENQNIRMRYKTNSSMLTVSKQKDVVMPCGIVEYVCTSDDETFPDISRQKGRSKVHSMEEFRLRNNKELQGNVIYEAKQYTEMSVKSKDGNEKDEVNAVNDDLVTILNKNMDGIKSERNKTVREGIKSNGDKYEIHTEVVKSANEGIFKDDGKSDFIEEDKSMKEGVNKCYDKCSLGGDSFQGKKHDKDESRSISEGVESVNETKDAHDIVIDTRKMERQVNNNIDDNSGVANIKNKNMNDVPCHPIIVMDRKEDIDKNCTFFDNSKSIEKERGKKLETVVRCTKHEGTQHDHEHCWL